MPRGQKRTREERIKALEAQLAKLKGDAGVSVDDPEIVKHAESITGTTKKKDWDPLETIRAIASVVLGEHAKVTNRKPRAKA